ncbi:Uu.00g116730.m01.CDS01 [Anthostomella pinea]|uniref:Uu.00g116730.m01.CDS01 n=1 Tax=Anthostomella pinea TaxID=933095 RepID=A0AAI8VG22_9PEZI|nr:Uu.00g116730.m01.CDS01 [Anthostomella pinea]
MGSNSDDRTPTNDGAVVPGNFCVRPQCVHGLAAAADPRRPGDLLERRHTGSGWEEEEDEVERRRTAQAQTPKGTVTGRGGGPPRKKRKPSEPSEDRDEAVVNLPCPIPPPNLSSDFRMKVTLSAQSASVAVGGGGFKKWTMFAGGVWSGQLGSGVVVSGGQDSQDLVYGKTMATQVEATHKLKTGDEPPAYIEVKSRGFRTGTREIMEALQDPEKAEQVDPRFCQYRIFITMKTTDERYADRVNVVHIE